MRLADTTSGWLFEVLGLVMSMMVMYRRNIWNVVDIDGTNATPGAGLISRVGGVADRMNQMRCETLGNVARILGAQVKPRSNHPERHTQILAVGLS